MFKLKIYNTISNQKETFEPVDLNHIRMYTCGPTVYNYAHIGNARPAIISDILVRVLRFLYPKVTYVSNITDIDDKIIESSQELGVPIEVLTEKYERIYNEDMQSIGVLPPDKQPHATDHIGEMIDLIQKNIDNDKAYVSDGHVLFQGMWDPSYQRYLVLWLWLHNDGFFSFLFSIYMRQYVSFNYTINSFYTSFQK